MKDSTSDQCGSALLWFTQCLSDSSSFSFSSLAFCWQSLCLVSKMDASDLVWPVNLREQQLINVWSLLMVAAVVNECMVSADGGCCR